MYPKEYRDTWIFYSKKDAVPYLTTMFTNALQIFLSTNTCGLTLFLLVSNMHNAKYVLCIQNPQKSENIDEEGLSI